MILVSSGSVSVGRQKLRQSQILNSSPLEMQISGPGDVCSECHDSQQPGWPVLNCCTSTDVIQVAFLRQYCLHVNSLQVAPVVCMWPVYLEMVLAPDLGTGLSTSMHAWRYAKCCHPSTIDHQPSPIDFGASLSTASALPQYATRCHHSTINHQPVPAFLPSTVLPAYKLPQHYLHLPIGKISLIYWQRLFSLLQVGQQRQQGRAGSWPCMIPCLASWTARLHRFWSPATTLPMPTSARTCLPPQRTCSP